jgi:hypothetical protein
MGIHLAAKGLYIKSSFGCHSNFKYTVRAFLPVFGLSVSGTLIADRCADSKESCHQLVRESARDGGHHLNP